MFYNEIWFTTEHNDHSYQAVEIVDYFSSIMKKDPNVSTAEEADAILMEGMKFFMESFDTLVSDVSVKFNPFMVAYFCMRYTKEILDPPSESEDYPSDISVDDSGLARPFSTDIFVMMHAYCNPQIISEFFKHCGYRPIQKYLAFAMISHERLWKEENQLKLKPDLVKTICTMECTSYEEYEIAIANEMRKEYAIFVYKNMKRYKTIFYTRRAWNSFMSEREWNDHPPF